MQNEVKSSSTVQGEWEISPEYGILSDVEGKKMVLEPRLAKLLHLLSVQSGRIVPRQVLIEAIWPDTIVNKESLTRAVADLRKALAAQYDNPPVIETIRKRGYQITFTSGPKPYAFKLRLSRPALLWTAGMIILMILLILFGVFTM